MFRWVYRFARHRPQTYKPVVVITGCSSGIGLALARLFRRQSEYRVVITAREGSFKSLRSRFVEDERFWLRPLDVTNPDQRKSLVREIEAKWGAVNVLINNAGVCYRAVVEHMTEADEREQMATNYLGPMGLIRQVLPGMRALGRGKIINVSSVSGMLAMPTMASYSASKHAIEGACEALWYEVKPLGIDVSMVQPGFVKSNSFSNVRMTQKSTPQACADAPYSDYYRFMTPFIARLMGWSRTSPEHIARLILKVIRTTNPPLWVPATLDAHIFYQIRRWTPRRFLAPLLFALLPGARRWAQLYTRRRVPREPDLAMLAQPPDKMSANGD